MCTSSLRACSETPRSRSAKSRKSSARTTRSPGTILSAIANRSITKCGCVDCMTEVTGSAPGRMPNAAYSVKPHILEVNRLAVDAARRRGNPIGKLAWLYHLSHERLDELMVALGWHPLVA